MKAEGVMWIDVFLSNPAYRPILLTVSKNSFSGILSAFFILQRTV